MVADTEPSIVRMQEPHLRQVFSLVDRENWGWEFVEIQQIHRLDPGSSVVALDGSDVVGLVTCVDFGTHAFIVHVIVKGGWRGRRVGARMMETVLAELDSRGVTAVELHANPEAVKFYNQFSFSSLEEISYLSKDPPHAHHADAEVGRASPFRTLGASASSLAGALSATTGYIAGDLENGLTRLPADRIVGRAEADRITALMMSRTGEDLNGLGPWFIETPTQADAEAMMHAMFAAIPAKRIDVMSPRSNTLARKTMESCGFTLAKEGIVRLVRSSRPVSPYPSSVFAAGHLGLI